MTSISGFFGSTIAPPGEIRVSWQAAPVLPQGSGPGQNPNNPGAPRGPNTGAPNPQSSSQENRPE
jgi:hypothetical protein